MNVSVRGRSRHYRTVTFDAGRNAVRLIEQRLLPHRFQIVSMADYRATARAIASMVVRGAGAIGATAAYGLAQGARAFRGRDLEKFRRASGLSIKHFRTRGPRRWIRSMP